MFWQILANENTKILRRRLFWVEIALVALIVIGLLLALYITVETNRNGAGLPSEERLMLLQTVTWPGALVTVLSLISGDGIGGLFLVILVGAVTAQEYTWRTLQLWLSRGIPRSLFVLAKFSALLLSAVLIVLAALITGSAITAYFSIQSNGSLPLEQVDFLHLVMSTIRTIYTLLPYGALTFLLAVASRSTVVAISGGLAYTLLLEDVLMQVSGLLGERLSQITAYLPGSLANSLLTLNQSTILIKSSLEVGSITPLQAGIGIGVWTLFFLGLSLWIFQRQDLSE